MSEMNEYSALHNGALFFDRSDRTRTRISGPRAAELLTGMVTNDVSSLVAGEGQYAAALTPKGKIVADLRIFALEDSLLVDTSPAAAPVSRKEPAVGSGSTSQTAFATLILRSWQAASRTAPVATAAMRGCALITRE